MRIPDPLPYAMARSGRGRVRHIHDWRRPDTHRFALCTQPVGGTLTPDEMALDLYRHTTVCSACKGKVAELRTQKVFIGTDHIPVEDRTLAQVVELALKAGAAADARFAIEGAYTDHPEIVLRWDVTE